MLSTIKVANLRNTTQGYRVDRASYLGNPFYLRSEAERNAVCDAYERYVMGIMTSSNPTLSPRYFAEREAKRHNVTISTTWREPTLDEFVNAIEELIDAHPDILLCWCSPKRCHADYLAFYVQSALASRALFDESTE